MLRSVFVGSPNRITKLLAHWLSVHTDLRGVVWSSSAYWSWSLRGRFQFIRKRLKRVGLLKTCDEALYYFLLHRRFLRSAANTETQTRLIDFYCRNYGPPHWDGDSIHTDDINSAATQEFVRQHQPDLIMSMCVNDYFGRKLREIPRLGCFLWHEGITPEYKGLFSPFWAIHNRELNLLGYSVLRMNHRYDEGEVFLQGPAVGVDPFIDSPHYIGHKAILDSLPAVKELLSRLEGGAAVPLPTANRKSAAYTYPGLSDGLRFAARRKRLRAEDAQSRETAKPLPLRNA